MAMLFVAFAAPAMAKGNGHNNNDNDFRINHFNDFRINKVNDGFFFGEPFFLVNDFGFENCPFAGDTEGIVNEFDCFA
jgi:hypothetical protein